MLPLKSENLDLDNKAPKQPKTDDDVCMLIQFLSSVAPLKFEKLESKVKKYAKTFWESIRLLSDDKLNMIFNEFVIKSYSKECEDFNENNIKWKCDEMISEEEYDKMNDESYNNIRYNQEQTTLYDLYKYLYMYCNDQFRFIEIMAVIFKMDLEKLVVRDKDDIGIIEIDDCEDMIKEYKRRFKK